MEVKKQNIILILGSLLIIFTDQISKFWAHSIKGEQDFLFLIFKKFYNPGISFGQFSSGEPFVRVVFLSLFFGIIFLTATIIIFYFLNKKSLFSIRYPVTFFISGIIGNGVDRILWGKVTDFIILKFYPHIVFNVADIFIAIFGVQSIIMLFKRADDIWYEENLRGFKIVDPDFQWSFSSKFAVLCFFSNFIMASFCYTVLSVIIEDESLKDQIMGHIALGFFGLTFFFAIFSLLFGLVVTHRSAGPVYAFKRFVNELDDNSNARLKLREQDFHKELEVTAEKVKTLINHEK